jgi:energy-coupling factor transporter ATP-binding protein EcfA2
MLIVNNESVPQSPPRLSEVLFDPGDRSFSSLAALPSNVEAIESGLLFATGLLGFVAITGPSGWGKSHLLGAVAQRLRRDEPNSLDPIPAATAIENGSTLDTPKPLILDEVQDALTRPRHKVLLRSALERRVHLGQRTLLAFTLPKPTRSMRNLLPCPREWKTATMGAAEPAERVALLNQLSAAEGLMLSPRLVRVIAMQMRISARGLSGALNRLRQGGTVWLDSASTLRACGILSPYFPEDSGWDLEHRILRIAEGHRHLFPRVNSTDLALYVMLHSAMLYEAHVARAAGLGATEAYVRAERYRTMADQEPALQGYVTQFVDLVVESLVAEA